MDSNLGISVPFSLTLTWENTECEESSLPPLWKGNCVPDIQESNKAQQSRMHSFHGDSSWPGSLGSLRASGPKHHEHFSLPELFQDMLMSHILPRMNQCEHPWIVDGSLTATSVICDRAANSQMLLTVPQGTSGVWKKVAQCRA